ncbi:MAG: AraC family transcriptional regulator [Anaerolineae bacterium]|nr:AraC family transcriptional regulator [Anaerolineae bacterium]
MMASKEWSQFWHNSQLDMGVLHAFYTRHAYPRHSHDYYVISVIQHGFQSFTHGGAKHYTPPGGLILINPDTVHTGEPVDANGFELRSLYPTTAHMQRVVEELTGRQGNLPYFTDVRVDHPQATANVVALHQALVEGASPLEYEARLVQTLALLVRQYAGVVSAREQAGHERKAIQLVRRYIEERFAEGISLQDLADRVALSPYYLLRVFHDEVGMPPYTYLESVRIRHAQQLIAAGRPLVDVALDVGFSSQSNFTRHFKRIIGVTPGQYAQHLKS